MHQALLDLQGLLCPLPVIRVQNKISTMMPGEVLKVLCTDPGTTVDIPCWCRMNKHHIIEQSTTNTTITFIIEVGES